MNGSDDPPGSEAEKTAPYRKADRTKEVLKLIRQADHSTIVIIKTNLTITEENQNDINA